MSVLLATTLPVDAIVIHYSHNQAGGVTSRYSYSEMVKMKSRRVDDESSSNNSMKGYPTIVDDNFVIEIMSSEIKQEDMTYSLFSVNGQVVFYGNFGKSISGERAITLGSFIVGNRHTEADPHNTTFQHEYGHYLQSQEMGLGYMFGVGIPSFISAIKGDGHRYKSFERDANWKAFIYFNKHVDDFYTSPEDWEEQRAKLKLHPFGWDFIKNPLVKEGTGSKEHYVDYKKLNGLNVTR